MIGLDGEKMSKSRGNLVFVSKLIAQGIQPMAIRWALLNRDHHDDTMWNDSLLAGATKSIERLQLNLSKLDVAPTDSVIQGLIDALASNLNTKGALEIIDRWMKETESGSVGGNAGELSRAIDSLLGIAL
jgi:L-cysteine:1D-myo-inositol 2-amino-2-deoxy-alpha-D-glucopyranoside ligase